MIFLRDSRYALSLMDIAPPGAERSILSVVVGEFEPLRSLDEATATELLLREIEEYLPLKEVRIRSTFLHANGKTPLFINPADSWAHRPSARTRSPNLYVAGDWCRNAIDLATMEGAVFCGREAASALLCDRGVDAPPPRESPTWPWSFYRVLATLGAGAMVVPWAIAKSSERRAVTRAA